MSADQIISWLQASLRWGGPLMLVSVGEVFAERSGVINVGIEGTISFEPSPVSQLAILQVASFGRLLAHWSLDFCLGRRSPT